MPSGAHASHDKAFVEAISSLHVQVETLGKENT